MLTILLFVLAGGAQPAPAGDPQAAPAGLERDIRVKLINASGRRLRAIHVSPSTASDWGQNLLGRGLGEALARQLGSEGLAATGRTEVAIPGECGVYDVRLVAEKGAEFLLDEVELCEDGDVLTMMDRELTHVKAGNLRPAGEPPPRQ